MWSRREFLGTAFAGWTTMASLRSAERAKSNRQLAIAHIERTTVRVPYRPIPERNMDRELPHWRYSEIVEVKLKSGHVGLGETLLYYTWGVPSAADVKRALGENAARLMWDDSLGAGLQMALFDAVAKWAEVPVHALLGKKVHNRTPLSWWNIETSPEDMVAECKEAQRRGYTAYKTKGRPWFDIWAQIDAVAKAMPKSFKLDIDFNDTLLDAQRAIPILRELEKYPHIGIWETPIFQRDIKGNQEIRRQTRVPIAMHYGTPDPLTAIKEDVCDGFVITGGASRVMAQAHVAAMADKPFWLQLVGTGITAAFSLHLGGVLSHATWPAVNCHQLFTHNMLTEEIAVQNGYAKVPDRPGLGYDLDRDALDRFRVPKPKQRPEPARLIETVWPDGRKMYVANTGRVNFHLDLARKGKIPFFERGVTTRLVPDDGSKRWRQLYEKARQQAFITK
ncbi:MAG: hypothetical protein KatS3mg105_3376 [Gemmatales bacterium]|nr:MAG: hypothetical protein KatS3mg105_3376 [Gemmatales bacterium]